MNNLLKAVQAYEDVLSAREGYQEIQRDIESIVNDLAGYFTKSTYTLLQMTESMIGICQYAIESLYQECLTNLLRTRISSAMEQELRQISHKQDRTIMTQYINVERDINDILERYRRVQTLLQRFLMNTNLEIWRVVDEQGIISQSRQSIHKEDRLGKIGSALSARYNSAEAAIVHRRDRTPETRKRVIADAQNWLQDNQSGKLFRLSGMAGTGKTTIANTLCGLLDGQHQLGASFFCTRLLPECRSPKLILPSIAHQLSRFSYPFRSSLARVLENNPDVHTQAIRIQFKRMIFDPLQEVAGSLPPDMLIVIDALDECDEPENAIQVLEMLITYASDLPTKFFVSSRSESQIRRAMAGLNSRMVLHELDDKVVKEDIRVYFRTELAYMSLSEQQISAMVERAGVLFIYAATAVRYIGARKNSVDAKKRLDIVLGVSGPTVSTKDKEIDSLYNAILASAFDDPDLEFWERDRMNNVLHTVICAQEPLTISALARFLEMDESEVRVAVDPLWLLLWFEILNLTKTMKSGSSLLDRVRSLWEMSDAPASIKALIYDAWRFVTMFATSPVSHSTAHIYVSMLT
ncbi:unnamed protein product [Rhizoctonia solani]|uniref:Nephrocystin 3-like N-terminal domain-containing protein n=1 Tax=Rhizoctonia solani TaxID=456999 RepID=A0A8H2XK58_9AGAM|nr:unnamed protein product [Rhizoctonia solani]